MEPNPVLRKLGFSDEDRVVIILADDLGMCQATVSAFADLVDAGLVSTGSAMVPGPWFPLLAQYCRQHPQVDMGVHLTLTSEYDHYRWSPLSTTDPASGLIDDEGYFYRRPEQVQEHGDAAAGQRELQAQVERALAAGIDVTHLDDHMGAVGQPKFASAHVQLAFQHRVPVMAPRWDVARLRQFGFDEEMASAATEAVLQLEAQGMPLLDDLVLPALDEWEDRTELAKQSFASLQAGLTCIVIAPARDSPELRAAAVNSWRARVADYEAYTSRELRRHVGGLGIQLIGYGALRELMRS